MKSINSNDAEKNAQKLRGLTSITPDKRPLLHEIVNAAPDHIGRDGRLNNYFRSNTNETEIQASQKQSFYRIYAGMAIVLVILLGGGMWLGLRNLSSQKSAPQLSEITATGKVADAVNAITQQAQSESKVAQTASIDSANLDAVSTQLDKMQDTINEKF